VKYLLIIHMNPATMAALSQEEQNAIGPAHEEFQRRTKETGEFVGFAALADPSQSKTVRVRNDVPVVTDGPFVEAKELLGGYYVVDCESAERAAELAALMPEARFAGVEVRPVMESAGLEM
jgi:hypothetical protein